MNLLPFDQERVCNDAFVFPDEIEGDGWIAYHGTSSIAEARIDAHGLESRDPAVDRDAVHSLMDVFSELRWIGEDHAGGLALSSYATGTFMGKLTKKIFLGEASFRSLTCAARDYAGGEVARAFRHGFDDLHRYLADGEIRRRHLAGHNPLSQGPSETVDNHVGRSGTPQSVSLSRLRDRLNALEAVYETVRQSFGEPARRDLRGSLLGGRSCGDDNAQQQWDRGAPRNTLATGSWQRCTFRLILFLRSRVRRLREEPILDRVVRFKVVDRDPQSQ